MDDCNWHFITDNYDGRPQDVDISLERKGLVVTGATFDAEKFEVRTEGGRIIVNRKTEVTNVDRPTTPDQ